MSRSLLIEPHLDDAVLFASYTILRERPVVCTALARTREGPTRLDEHFRALGILGAHSRQLPEPETRPNWQHVEQWMHDLKDEYRPSHVFAPAIEENGHDQHNSVAFLAAAVFEGLPIVRYMTYQRGHGRSRGATEVVPEPGWPSLKLQSMAQYASQINRAATMPWFAAGDMLREWYQ